MLASDVLTRVRDQISDDTAPYRWTDPELLRYLDDAQFELVRNHPEAQYVSAVTNDDLTAVTGTGQTLQVQDQYRSILVNKVAEKALGDDSEDMANLVLGQSHERKSDKGLIAKP